MTFEQAFKKIKTKFENVDASKLQDMALQITLSDEDCGGTLYAAVKNGTLAVEPYDYKDNDAVLDVTRAALTSILSGKTSVEAEIENGNLTVKGNLEKISAVKAAIKVPEKPAAKKAPAKKAAVKKDASEAPAKKAPAKKAAGKKDAAEAAVKKAPAKKAVGKKETAEAPVKKEAVKTETQKTPVKKEAVKPEGKNAAAEKKEAAKEAVKEAVKETAKKTK